MPCPIIPIPRQCHGAPGTFSPGTCALHVHPEDAARPALRARARALGLRVKPDRSLPPHAAAIGTADPLAAPNHPEGYALHVAPSGVFVQGADARGLVWGLVTLGQWREGAAALPCGEIADWPEYAVRYHHDDISRKQVSTVKDFKRIIRHLSEFKVGHYTPYIEDMLAVDGIPQMGEGRGALSAAEVREIVAEGERWQVEVFPTLSLAGHQENLLRLPRYRPMGARSWQPPSAFDPRHPEVRGHLLKVIEAACAVFPSPIFHMCFDEIIGWDAEMFVAHANWCAEQLVERGKTPLFWADMLYNHFGCALLERLHPALVPVAWGYDTAKNAAKQIPALLEMQRYRPRTAVLAGYNSWCSFFQRPLADLQEQWGGWRASADPGKVWAFGASQWGDEGYENSRDLGWMSFAAFAEQAWSGDAGDPASVPGRFQRVFYGRALPDLERAHGLLASGLALDPGTAWQLHRLPAPGWVRRATTSELPSPERLEADAATLDEAEQLVEAAAAQAEREAGHLDHYRVAIARLRSTLERARAARDPSRAPKAVAALGAARKIYRRTWLRHNRPENIEVSLAVFDRQQAGWKAVGKSPRPPWPGWCPLDLGALWGEYRSDVAGAPIGLAEIGEVPFRFAPVGRTHAEIRCGESVSIPVPAHPLRDIHLVIVQGRESEEAHPAARLRLWRGERLVYEEELLAIRHLCDWWAPLGEHMWAGGGLAYADPVRVRYLLSPNPPYGLTCVSRFGWPAAPVADRLEIACVAGKPLALFAVTLEWAAR